MAAESDAIGVLIIDAQPIYRSALEQVCDELDGLRVVASCGTAADGLAQLEETRPGIAVVDPILPDYRAMGCLRVLCARATEQTHVLVLTSEEDSASVYNALAFGAAGYLSKSCTDFATL